MNRAVVLREQGKYAEAVSSYDQALLILKEQAPPADYARCLVNWANVLDAQGKHAEAVSGYDQALPILKEHAPPADYANCLHNRADTLRLMATQAATAGRSEEASLLFQAAAEGSAHARRVLRSARRYAGADDTGIEFHRSFARFFRVAVQTGLAGELHDAAYDAVRDGKAGVVDDLTYKLRQARRPEPLAIPEARFQLTDWMRTKTPRRPSGHPLSDAQLEEFENQVANYFSMRDGLTRRYLSVWGQHAHAYDATRTTAPEVEDTPTRSVIQAELPPRWALIDFWGTGANEFHAFVLFRDDFRVIPLPIPLETLAPRLEQTAVDVRSVREREPQLAGLDDIGQNLFRPLLPLLREKGIEGLYLVPHEFLHHFPLHAARIGKKYLCDEFSIAYLPSANMLPNLPRPDATGRPFVLANPEHGTEHTLPFAHWEGQELRRALVVPPDRFFLGASGRFAATDQWGDCGFVHFSCHGSGDQHFAPRSHLRLADDLLLAHDVLHRKPELRKGAVVVLNGCQTSVPDWRAINEGMGLMTAFLLRGAGVVLSTQWSVLDMCAADMVLTFAQEIRKPGTSPAAALKTAQTQLRNTAPLEMLKRMDGVSAQFREGSIESAKLLQQRAWLCLRAGLLDEALASAGRAAAPLRDFGLRADADELTETTRKAAKDALPTWFQRTGFDNPVFWSAFQLVGRIA
jgi:CHAT domain-containing protein